MAAVLTDAVMNDGDKLIHPLFARQTYNTGNNGTDSYSPAEVEISGDGSTTDGDSRDGDIKSGKRNKLYKPPLSAAGPRKTQKSITEILTPSSNNTRATEVASSIQHEETFRPEYNPQQDRRKRRRTNEGEAVDSTRETHDPTDSATPSDRGWRIRQVSPQVILSSSPPPNDRFEMMREKRTPPKKMLRLNASGKFSSPVSKPSKHDELSTEPARRRGRPRKPRVETEDKTLIARLRYTTIALGHKIDRILSSTERHAVEAIISATPSKRRTPRKQPPKPTHPFFTSKVAAQPLVAKTDSPRKASAVTPGKLRSQTMASRLIPVPDSGPSQEYVIGSSLLKDRLMFKHPGAREPAWPRREQVHVRAFDEALMDVKYAPCSLPSYRRRKRKTADLPFPTDESILLHFWQHLTPELEGTIRPDGFREPHPSLRLARKLLAPGEGVLERLACETSFSEVEAKVVEVSSSVKSSGGSHPAIRKLQERIRSDESEPCPDHYAHMGWVQKYEPVAAAEVLQPSQEMTTLKEWLRSLAVTSVESVAKSESRTVFKAELRPKKKQRRKPEDLDDFLVDDDEDIHNMDEILEPAGSCPSSSLERISAKSIVQVASDAGKLSNAVLLSGSHGCGKTAAAYAVAKELGFKVFEISPSERRSGKDVLEKVGNMTENHLVRHHGTPEGNVSAAEEPTRLDEDFRRDLDSGRQGKMNAFFQARPKSQKVSSKPAKTKHKALEAVHQVVKKAAKEQQQSMILLEEVDILFPSDKDFWTTILRLITTSKRPFIMTCNNEDLVPLQVLKLHAVLRLSPPAVALATDYLLTMAAAEGHLLQRAAVEALYEAKQHDLRASIAELDFWCQVGIGDPRGGLSWVYQRYPPGSDLDEQGRRLRIVSERTYQEDMAILIPHGVGDDTKLLWAHYEFGTPPADVIPADSLYGTEISLRQFSTLINCFGDADVFSGLAIYGEVPDTTQMPMSDKARSQYIEGLPLLQTDEKINHLDLSVHLSIATALSACRVAGLPTQNHIQESLASRIRKRHVSRAETKPLTRHDFSCFDALSSPRDAYPSTLPSLTQSSFDSPLKTLATDLAPYVRSIVHYDLELAEQRDRLNNLLSDGGHRHAKRARTTRAARSALEGSERANTRRENWFTKALNVKDVLATGGRDWPKVGLRVARGWEVDGTETPGSSAEV